MQRGLGRVRRTIGLWDGSRAPTLTECSLVVADLAEDSRAGSIWVVSIQVDLDGLFPDLKHPIPSPLGAETSCVDEVAIDVAIDDAGTELAYSASNGLAIGTLTRGTLLPDTGSDDTDGAAGSGQWPTGADDGPFGLPASFAVNVYEVPTWVSCDDGGRWCAAEQDPKMLGLNKNGLRETGRAPLAPVALHRAGMPARQVVS